ncbi:MAG: sirohydrochlorin chelatase, partial [Symploca sp. SIO2G7]|nr:sirohydrochlorin chelatase [Symploca sp. SIO2G7]
MAKLAELVHDQLNHPNYIQTPKFTLPDIEQTAPVLVVNQNRYPLVGTATLELAPSPLHEQIQQFANLALRVGCQEVQLLPLFLLPGVHVMEDIPAEAAQAQANLGDSI